MEKKLYRSQKNVLVAGVLAGFAEYFGHDRILWRFCFIVFLILTGFMPGVLIYAIAWFMIPKNPLVAYTDVTYTQA
jgi:phage shock protein C